MEVYSGQVVIALADAKSGHLVMPNTGPVFSGLESQNPLCMVHFILSTCDECVGPYTFI